MKIGLIGDYNGHITAHEAIPIALKLIIKKHALAYGMKSTSENYHCGFGFNTEFESRFVSNNFIITGRDNQDNARSFELADHPFFVATLFQPERTALKGIIPTLILAFVKAGASANKS
ncbi:MAG: hypothetical protein K0R12_71 [Gammaproteobacteria bacterium]|jgi:CTP synthase (UTP-ammonia lyase)|nr:hypothetical protein [Gammaproteobacteria bacterium]